MKRIRKGDNVRVMAGKERGKEGKVIGFTSKKDRVLVEKEAGIHLSNVMLLTPSGHPTRVQFKERDGKKVRYSVKYDEYID